MSKNILKVDKSTAKQRLTTQIEKGKKLIELSHPIIESKENYYKQNLAKDNYILQFNHWQSFTKEMLDELFKSTSYSYQFDRHRSEHIGYSDRTVEEKLNYIVGALLIPKIEYIRILVENLDEFVVVTPGPTIVEHEPERPIQPTESTHRVEIEKLTIVQLVKQMTLPQIVKLLGTLFALLSGAFYLGLNLHNWNLERENNILSNQVQQLQAERDMAIAKRDSVARPLQETQKQPTDK